MKYLRVKNWESFQHYKDRNPPWIKLHRDLLRDYDFICLQDASKMQLMLIWLLASQMDNKIPADPDFIKSQLGLQGEVDLKELIDKGFLVDDSNLLADCKQVAIVETEAETETYRKETETERGVSAKPPSPKKSIIKKGSRISEDWELSDEWGDWSSEEFGWSTEKIITTAEQFKDYWLSASGQKGVKLDWYATWRNWCRKQQEGF